MNLPDIVKTRLLSLGANTTDTFLAAVSGGADSTALLLAMHDFVEKKGHLKAAHLDHGVRSGSDEDALIVVDLCEGLGVPLVTGKLEPEELEIHHRRHGSLEAGMRVLRYRFLSETARETGSKWIVTGHTANDQAETVLFRIARGMDWRSLASIPGRRERVLRPLLGVSRSGTWNYCHNRGVNPVRDPSNYDGILARSRIRNRILPGLATHFNTEIYDLLCRVGSASNALSLVEEGLLNIFGMQLRGAKDHRVQREHILALPQALRKGFIINYLFKGMDIYPSLNLAEDVLAFVLDGRNGQWSLPGDRTLTLSYGMLSTCRNVDTGQSDLPSAGLELTIPGRLVIPRAGMAIEAAETTLEEPGRYPWGESALLSAKRLTGSLWVRKRQSGDLFWPIGMKGEKKLKDFLIDRKVPKAVRDRIPIVLDSDGNIVWVGGIEVGQRAALDGIKGEKAILIRIEVLGRENASEFTNCAKRKRTTQNEDAQ